MADKNSFHYNKPSFLQAELKISGLVQGVFFRDFIQTAALENNIKGWVKNAPDGSVEALVQGSPADLNDFTEKCKRGPVGSRVEKVDLRITEIPELTFKDFAAR